MTFRPLRRTKNAISQDAARQLLLHEKRGVLAVNGDGGYPYAVPVNFYYDAAQDKIYFHGAKAGHKFDSIRKDGRVCFTVYGNERLEPGQWAPYVQSAVAFGTCRLIDDAAVTEAQLRLLAARYYPSPDEIDAEVQKALRAVQLYEISIEHLCGKQIQEK